MLILDELLLFVVAAEVDDNMLPTFDVVKVEDGNDVVGDETLLLLLLLLLLFVEFTVTGEEGNNCERAETEEAVEVPVEVLEELSVELEAARSNVPGVSLRIICVFP